MPTTICCLSDLHGYLPTEIPKADLLLLAGDYCPMRDVRSQARWMREKFAPWLAGLAKRMRIVGVAGNHDFIFERAPELVPAMDWTYLEDSGCEFRGLKVHGSPWQPIFGRWSFNASESDLARKWSLIPDDTDILLLHGPPRGCGDVSRFSGEHCGSPSLAGRIREVRPRLVVAGHIHEGHGRHRIGDTLVVNASFLDEAYFPANAPIVIELP